MPIDISRDHLRLAASALAADYPRLTVRPVCADFARPMSLPRNMPAGPRIGFFPGSTIGNLHPPDAACLLIRFARQLGADGWLLIGVDLKKDSGCCTRPITTAPGLRRPSIAIFVRINRELDGRFDLESFDHSAFWNDKDGRIEMHLVSAVHKRAVASGRAFRFAAGESDSHRKLLQIYS